MLPWLALTLSAHAALRLRPGVSRSPAAIDVSSVAVELAPNHDVQAQGHEGPNNVMPQPLARRLFCGTWRIASQDGRDAFLDATPLPCVLRLAFKSGLELPAQTLFFDENGTRAIRTHLFLLLLFHVFTYSSPPSGILHCHTGPLLGHVSKERCKSASNRWSCPI